MCFKILYNQSKGWTEPNKKKERISFRQRVKENGIQNTSTIKKKRGNFCIYFVSFWRHGRAVRRGTANPFSPVQIRVSPDQQKNRNTLFCFADITCLFFQQKEAEEKDSWYLLDSKHPGGCSLKCCNYLRLGFKERL